MAFEDFALGELIGAGTFGRVYKAKDTIQDRTVAVKLTRFLLEADHDHAMFRHEREAAGRVSAHPNIVTLHESGMTSDNRGYMVFDYFPDGNLAANLEQLESVPWRRVLAWAIELAEALVYAHGRQVWHRDIKPANVLLDGDRACLADFGEAKRLDGTMTNTGGGFTSIFVAPERVLDHVASPSSDIYSLGVTLYLTLTGELPYGFAPDTSAVVVALHARSAGVPRFPRVAVPGMVFEVLANLLEPDPSNRTPTAVELRDQLVAVRTALDQEVVVRAQTEAAEARIQAEEARALAEAARTDANALRVDVEAARGDADERARVVSDTQTRLEASQAELVATRAELVAARAEVEATRTQAAASDALDSASSAHTPPGASEINHHDKYGSLETLGFQRPDEGGPEDATRRGGTRAKAKAPPASSQAADPSVASRASDLHTKKARTADPRWLALMPGVLAALFVLGDAALNWTILAPEGAIFLVFNTALLSGVFCVLLFVDDRNPRIRLAKMAGGTATIFVVLYGAMMAIVFNTS